METLKKRPGIQERPVGEEHMLYDATGRKVHVLNETAFFVWNLCDGNQSQDDIIRRAGSDFEGGPASLREDIASCIAEFHSLGLLETTV